MLIMASLIVSNIKKYIMTLHFILGERVMWNKKLPRFQEEYSAKIPALTLLTQLGWSFGIPPILRGTQK